MFDMKTFLKRIYNFSNTWVGTIIFVLIFIFFIAQSFIIPSRSMVGTLYEGDMLLVKKFSYGIPLPQLPWVNWRIFPDIHHNGHLFEGRRPNRGEVVVFIPPHQKNVFFVKRNFAVGGDEVIFTKKGFYLYCHEGNEYIKKHFQGQEMLEFAGKLFVYEPYSKDHLGIHYAKDNWEFNLMEAIMKTDHNYVIANNGEDPSVERISMKPINLNGELAFYKKIPQDEFFMIGDNRDNSDDSRFWGSVPYRNIIGTPWVTLFSINLKNSQEVDAENNPKKRYTIRWNRMFKTISTLEEEMKKEASR